MTSLKDSEIECTDPSVEQLRMLIAATGLPAHIATEMLQSDQDLDELCDTVLSMFATDGKT